MAFAETSPGLRIERGGFRSRDGDIFLNDLVVTESSLAMSSMKTGSFRKRMQRVVNSTCVGAGFIGGGELLGGVISEETASGETKRLGSSEGRVMGVPRKEMAFAMASSMSSTPLRARCEVGMVMGVLRTARTVDCRLACCHGRKAQYDIKSVTLSCKQLS